jgi:hypothetical protein
MQRQEQVIQLSDHVKNKLKQHQYLPPPSPFINSSDEFIEINSTDDDHGKSYVFVSIDKRLMFLFI